MNFFQAIFLGLVQALIPGVSRIADFFDVSVDSLLGREPLEVK
jgi:hypothetical protein